MRILATAYDFRPRLGGIATLTHELLRALARIEGVELRVLAPASDGAAAFDSSSTLDIRRFRVSGKGAPDAVPLAMAIAREALSWRPDLVLNFLWMPDGVGSLLASPVLKSLGIPYYVFAYGKELLESRATLKKRLRQAASPLKRAVFGSAKGAFAISQFTHDLIEAQCGLPREKIRFAYPGIDPAQFRPGPKPEDLLDAYRLRGKKVFLTVTRLEDYKGVDRVIAALSKLRDAHPDARYLVCGTGPDRFRLETLARHYRVADRVVFAGAIPHERLQDHYNLADVFIMLSRDAWESTDVEGFGIVFVEAAGCGKPSIGGRSGGIPDAVGDEKTGWLVDSEDPADAARAMDAALRDPELVRAKGERARERALRGFTWDRMAESVLEAIRVRD